MAEIPTDLITQILRLLPVKSLLRFRCVSKSLCSILDSVEFINSHLITTCENMIHRKIIFQAGLSGLRVCDMSDGRVEEDNKPKLFPSSQQLVHGYCNGLLLLCGGAFLWNPSTRQVSTVPNWTRNVRFHSIIGLGLGCDSTGDYKAVFILLCRQSGRIHVGVFGVRSNSWRKVEVFPYGKIKFGMLREEYSFGYFADGSLHWLTSAFFENNSQPEIIAFDVSKETFSLLPLPVCSIPMGRDSTQLHVLEGCICISFFCYGQADLYARKKDKSWTQLYSIKEPIILNTFRFREMKVIGYLKGRNKILVDFGMEDLVSYDVEKKCFEKDETKKSPLWKHPILCIQSLVSALGSSLF